MSYSLVSDIASTEPEFHCPKILESQFLPYITLIKTVSQDPFYGE